MDKQFLNEGIYAVALGALFLCFRKKYACLEIVPNYYSA